jgi:hypothetical protein
MPQWTHFPLDGAALEVSVDPVSGAAWATTATKLFKLEGATITWFDRAAGSTKLAVDRLGDVWSGRGSALVRLKAGAGTADVKFAADLRPWLMTHCSMCHADFTDVVAFTPRAEAALQKVKSGDMPRCTGGVPCAPDQRLLASQYAVLEGWIRGGKQP